MHPSRHAKKRMENALWGLFVGDALAMPAHWYYSLEHLKRDFGGGISNYVDPPHPHPESFMVGMPYLPDLEKAKALGRPYDILHEHSRFYNTTFSTLKIKTTERESEHGNAVPRPEERYHYHHGLRAGENTLGAQLVRVLMRSIIRLGRYDPQVFIDDFITYLTTPGLRRDPYTEIYICRWFEHYCSGADPLCAAELQRNVWSLGSHGGVIRPLLLSMISKDATQGVGLAIEHQNLTHRSETIISSLSVLVPMLHELLVFDAADILTRYASKLHLPKITGAALSEVYRAHNGPGNISEAEMWQLHMSLREEAFNLSDFAEKAPGEVVMRELSTACYPEHGVPLLLYFAQKNGMELEKVLLANVNAGGDNVHRGMILGLLVGAAASEVPSHLIEGLREREALQKEIAAFAEIAAYGDAL